MKWIVRIKCEQKLERHKEVSSGAEGSMFAAESTATRNAQVSVPQQREGGRGREEQRRS